jgi:transcriptional regulator with XRE-family HTH domain
VSRIVVRLASGIQNVELDVLEELRLRIGHLLDGLQLLVRNIWTTMSNRLATPAARPPGTSGALLSKVVAESHYTFPVADPYEKEARRLAGLIGSLVELSGRPVEEVAERAGLNPEELAGIFRGEAEMRVSHVLRIGEALGMHPGEFLYLAYPRRMPARGSTRDLLAKARAALKAQSEAVDSTPDGPESRGPSGEGPASPPAGGRPRGGRGRP